jgi:hypothetical protein
LPACRAFFLGGPPSEVVDVPKGGGAPRADACGAGGALAVDDTSVYWTRTEDGALMRTPSSGGAPVVVAAAQGASAIAVDACSVYWIAGHTVMKAAKPPLPSGDAGAASCSVPTLHCDGTACNTASDCPAPTKTCFAAACNSFCCATVSAAWGTACSGASYCDGNGHCVKKWCTDGTKNGDETDVDCGGSCPPCASGNACLVDADCVTSCGPDKRCT